MTFNQERIPTRLRHVFIPVAEHKRTYLFTFVNTAANFDETAPGCRSRHQFVLPGHFSRDYREPGRGRATDPGLPQWALITIGVAGLMIVITAAYLLLRKR